MLRRLMPEWDPHRVGMISVLPGGYSHRNYRITYSAEAFVIRLPAAGASAEDARFEGGWLRGLPAGLGAEIVAFDPETGALLSRWIDAPLLVDTTPAPQELADYLVALHRRMPGLYRRYDLPSQVRQWLGHSAQPAAVLKARRRLVPTGALARPCHNDLNPWNILCDPGGWRTLDWEWVGLNDPLFDLVTLGLGVGVSAAELRGMAAGYLARQEPPGGNGLEERLEQAVLGFWLREYAWAFDARRRGNARAEVEAQLDHALARLQEIAGD